LTAVAAVPRPSPPAIVCVDDDLPLLHTLREQLLRGLGGACDIELASSGEEALALLEELHDEGVSVPLLISDHHMRGMLGTELLVRAHDRYPQTLAILLTGQADVDAVGHAVNRASLYRLLTKPWQEGDLVLTVKEALRRLDQDRQIARHAALLQATMDATPDGLLVLDLDGQVQQLNRPFAVLWHQPEPLPRDGAALLPRLRAHLLTPEVLELDAVCPLPHTTLLELRDGRCIEYVGRPYQLDGRHAGAVYHFRDVTDRERSTRLIRHQALHDSLSGLPNRLQFSQALAQAVDQARAAQTHLAVLFVDLDHFKRVNDVLGHDCGDELLRQAARRLAHCLRQGDLIARWGGDEFTVLAPQVASPDEASALAGRIVQSLEQPFRVGEQVLRISASVGLARYPADGDDGQTLLRRADVALYRAKDGGRNGFACFRSGDDALAGASTA
jgi:diguanylate cyclase (GGDEF)-like protein